MSPPLKILMAPINFSNQPVILANELRKRGIETSFLEYAYGKPHPFYGVSDRFVNLIDGNSVEVQQETLKKCLEEGFNVFHFWQKSLFYMSGGLSYSNGLDIPLIKHRKRKIVYRFTGFDIRLKSEHIKRNPYNPFRYGYECTFDEELQRRYIGFLGQYVDRFIVQDAEMREFLPGALVIPRAIDLKEWPNEGIKRTDRPLIVHAPSKPAIKGTRFVNSAIEDLKAEGLKFDYKQISGLSHKEAIEWYKKADIAVDQLHIGWYGVFAVECMALGKAVIVYIRPDLMESHHPRLPIENANPDNVKEKIRSLVKDFDKRQELGSKARHFVEGVHDVSKVASKHIDVYNGLFKKEDAAPVSYADIEYISWQCMRQLKEIARYRFKLRQYEEWFRRPSLYIWKRFIEPFARSVISKTRRLKKRFKDKRRNT